MSIVWSYSALRMFTGCPYRFKRIRVDRAYREKPSPAMEAGRKIHEEIASAVQAMTTGAPLPKTDAVQAVEPVLRKLLPAEQVRVEWQMGVTRDWEPCDFYASEVWGRAVADLVCRYRDGTVVVVDWKTGRVRQNDDQLLLTLAVVTTHMPATRMYAGYFHLDTCEMRGRAFRHEEIEKLRTEGYGPLLELEAAMEKDLWPPRPSTSCRWCPVLDCRVRR